MSFPLAAELLTKLGIAAFERVAEQRFQIVGQMPVWLQEFQPDLQEQTSAIELSTLFPFLEYFLVDAEALWATTPQQRLKSGLWFEQNQAGQILYLEASALQIGTQKIVLIEAQEDHALEKITLIQKARENVLSHLSDRKQTSQELLNSTFYNSLTGLPNQTYFALQLTQVFESCRRDQSCQAAVLAIAIDRFRLITSSLGYGASEQLLVQFVWRVKEYLPSEAVLAHSDGAELVLLLPHLPNLDQATHLANQILGILKPPFIIDHQEVFVSTNIGIATSHADYTQAQNLLRDAHTALEQAKALGGSLIVTFDPAMHRQAVSRFHLENDLQRAVGDQELQVYYQPILSIDNESITGFEALVRWFHPARGPIAPLGFLPIAESLGLINAVDLWVTREVCFRIQQWRQVTSVPLSMSVNLSAHQLRHPQLIQQIRQILKETNIAPHSLNLEFPEQALLSQLEVAQAQLEQLKTLGVRLCIDDFSAGYAALDALQRLPIDVLKIEQSHMRSQNQSPEPRQQLGSSVIQLAHALDIQVSAKGVETRQQLQSLSELDCDYAQGCFFSAPLNSATATKLLRRHQQ